MTYDLEIGTERNGNQQRVLLRLRAHHLEASTPHKLIEMLLARAAEEVVKKQLPPEGEKK